MARAFEVTYNIYVRLVFEKAYDGMLTTPVETDDILFGEVLWALTRSCIYGGGFFIIAGLFGLIPFPAGADRVDRDPVWPAACSLRSGSPSPQNPDDRHVQLLLYLFLTPLFLFSGVFFPLAERLPGYWLWVAEVLPLLHPVRLTRMIFAGELSWVALWDAGYIVVVAAALLLWARRSVRPAPDQLAGSAISTQNPPALRYLPALMSANTFFSVVYFLAPSSVFAIH